jgi:hypothetical protein
MSTPTTSSPIETEILRLTSQAKELDGTISNNRRFLSQQEDELKNLIGRIAGLEIAQKLLTGEPTPPPPAESSPKEDKPNARTKTT